jgi:hypothetical protein
VADGVRQIPRLVPKLRDIYVRLGKSPEEVAEAAQADQTVLRDLLSENVAIPETFIRDIEREIIYNDSRSVKVEAVKTGTAFSLEDRPRLRAYLGSINPEKIKALKYIDHKQYLTVLKDMVNNLFPEGAALRFRTENGVYDYEHLLKDTTRQDYIATMPKTLKNFDIHVEFTTVEGAEKAYLIKKFFDPDIQKDIWDMIIIQDGELKTKFITRGRKGESSIEGKILSAGNEAPRSATPPGDTGSAPTPERSTGMNIVSNGAEVKADNMFDNVSGISRKSDARPRGMGDYPEKGGRK